MKNRITCVITLMLVALILATPTWAAFAFLDIDGYEEFAEAVAYVNGAGIMVGDNNGNFNSHQTVTRAEMATIICRMLDQTDGLKTSDTFSDVPISHWANTYVSKAADLGIVNGYGNGKFGPSNNVTYEQGVTMIVRAVGGDMEAAECGGYPDGFLSVAEKYGLIEGVAAEKGEALSRADIAIILYNCMA